MIGEKMTGILKVLPEKLLIFIKVYVIIQIYTHSIS